MTDPQKRSDESSTLALLGKKYVDYKARSPRAQRARQPPHSRRHGARPAQALSSPP